MVIEIDASSGERRSAAERLARGEIILLRGIPALKVFRDGLVAAVADDAAEGRPEMEAFLGSARIPSMATLAAVARTIRKVRAQRYLSQCLAPLVAELGFQAPVRVDGGIPRCVVPPAILAEAKTSPLFVREDFERVRADGETEAFMPRPANVHRDYNRQHFLLQCNLWFPLHDADEDEVLRIYPHLYRENVTDMDASPENFGRLGAPLRYRLNFGDAILFHGEHLHTSPSIRSEFRRRFSYDFRIASLCADDTQHYREFFLDLRNFDAGGGSWPLETTPSSEPGTTGLRVLLAVEQGEIADPRGLEHALAAFDRLPFVEDRYLILAERSARIASHVTSEAASRVIERSPLWFWAFKAAGILLNQRQIAAAAQGFERARALAGAVREMPDFMPIRYANGPTQPLPGAVVSACDTVLQRLQLARSA